MMSNDTIKSIADLADIAFAPDLMPDVRDSRVWLKGQSW